MPNDHSLPIFVKSICKVLFGATLYKALIVSLYLLVSHNWIMLPFFQYILYLCMCKEY